MPRQSAPSYQKIKSHVIGNIDSGRWAVEQQVPTEVELMKTFGVSRMTVNRALRELAAEGRIRRHPGRGSFVLEQRPKSELVTIRSIAEEITERGRAHSSIVHRVASEKALPDLARAFGVAPASPLFHTLIVHCENGVPVQLEDRFVNPALMPRYIEADFTQVTPNQVLASVAQVREADQIIEAILPDADTRAMLRIKASEPCLLVYRVARIEGGVSSIAWLTYPGSRYRLSSRFRTSGATLHGD